MTVHWPMFSIANDHLDTELLQTRMYPIMQKYKVDALIAGHTHTLQYATWPYNQDLIYKTPVINDWTCHRPYELNPSGKRSVTTKQGDTLHHFIVGATGKDVLEYICTDYQKRSTGNF